MEVRNRRQEILNIFLRKLECADNNTELIRQVESTFFFEKANKENNISKFLEYFEVERMAEVTCP